MSKETYQIVLAELAKLDAAELQQVRVALDFLSKGKPLEQLDQGKPGLDTGENEFCYTVMREVLTAKGWVCPHFNGLQRLDIYRHFEKHFETLTKYVEQYFPGIDRTDRQRLYHIFAELMVDWLEELRLPLKIGIFCKNLGEVPALMARAFPGYAESGMLQLVLDLGDRHWNKGGT